MLPLVHGLYNGAVGFLSFYQGWLGLKIRRARRSQSSFPLAAVKRHRKIGPFLPFLAGLGFLAGLLLIALDRRRILAFPAHFALGLALVLLLFLQKRLGARIKGPLSPLRTPHFLLGILILIAFSIQVLLGLSILL